MLRAVGIIVFALLVIIVHPFFTLRFGWKIGVAVLLPAIGIAAAVWLCTPSRQDDR